MRSLLLCCCTALAAFAQNGSELRPRTFGAAFDAEARSVRLMVGSPGAAVLGARLALGEFDRAAVASRRGYVLGVSDGRLRAASIDNGRALAAFDFTADLLALSPDETAAAAYSSADRTLAVLSGLPGAARLTRLDVPGADAVTAVAVSDDGSLALTASADGVVLAHRNGEARQIATAGRIASIRLAGGTALLADESQNMVWRLSLDDGALTPAARLPGPAIDAAFASAGRVFAIVRDARAVYVADASGEVSAVECDCSPARLDPLPGRARFLLTAPEHGALWILDAGGAAPAVYFVPSADGGKE